MRETLGDHIFEHFLEAKREEWFDYIRHVSPWELRPCRRGRASVPEVITSLAQDGPAPSIRAFRSGIHAHEHRHAI
jgi:hypothetical protein